MNNTKRYKRLRLLISSLNKQRKKQAKQIDILCNDFISAQQGFIKKLGIIAFKADFYESILGAGDLNNLLRTSAELIWEEVPDSDISFFLRQGESFALHMFYSDESGTEEKYNLEDYFTPDVVKGIFESNELCSVERLLELGLQVKPTILQKISAFTIPFGRSGLSLGFILIYSSAENKITNEQLNCISKITPGLSKAITTCEVLSHSEN